MKRFLLVVVALLAVLVATIKPVQGCGYGMPSPLVRFAQADYVVVGEIVQYEIDPVVTILDDPAKTKLEYRVAIIQITQNIKGADEVNFLRLASCLTRSSPFATEAASCSRTTRRSRS